MTRTGYWQTFQPLLNAITDYKKLMMSFYYVSWATPQFQPSSNFNCHPTVDLASTIMTGIELDSKTA